MVFNSWVSVLIVVKGGIMDIAKIPHFFKPCKMLYDSMVPPIIVTLGILFLGGKFVYDF